MCLWLGEQGGERVTEGSSGEGVRRKYMQGLPGPGGEFIFPEFSGKPCHCFNQVGEHYYHSGCCGENGVEKDGHMNIEKFW